MKSSSKKKLSSRPAYTFISVIGAISRMLFSGFISPGFGRTSILNDMPRRLCFSLKYVSCRKHPGKTYISNPGVLTISVRFVPASVSNTSPPSSSLIVFVPGGGTVKSTENVPATDCLIFSDSLCALTSTAFAFQTPSIAIASITSMSPTGISSSGTSASYSPRPFLVTTITT